MTVVGKMARELYIAIMCLDCVRIIRDGLMAGLIFCLVSQGGRVDVMDQILEILISAAQLQISAELVKVIVILTQSALVI